MIQKVIKHLIASTPEENNLLEKTARISFELSNLCNYAFAHKKCPIALEHEPIVLSSKVVYSVLDSLARQNFEGKIAFHTYNEPLIDPRLFKFIDYAREVCPKAYIYICSNGYYFDQNLAKELEQLGVSEIRISAYSLREFERLSKIDLKIPYTVERQSLDNRLDQYDREPIHSSQPCYAPLSEICVSRDGYVILCCLDWKKAYEFGDLNKVKLEDILASQEIHDVYERLSKGDRFLALCKRCDWSR